MESALVSLIRRRSRRIRTLPSGVSTRGQLPRAPRAVLFDVYGTLLLRMGDPPESAPRVKAELRDLLRRHKLAISPTELEELLREAIRRDHARLRARGVRHPEVDIERIWRMVISLRDPAELRRVIVEHELALHPCWPMPGSRRLISTLRRRGIILGIVSNAQFYTPLFFEALVGAAPRTLGFVDELCLYSFQRRRAKPAADMFEQAAAALMARGIRRAEVLVVGNDPVNDMAAGAGAGFMTALVCADRRSVVTAPPGLWGMRPHVVLGRLGDLPPVLARAGAAGAGRRDSTADHKNSTRGSFWG